MEGESGNANSSRRTSAGSETLADAPKGEVVSAGDKTVSQKAGDEQQSNSNQEDNDDDDKEGDDDDDDDKEKVIEKSHNERFLKKNAQILSYKVPGVNAYVSFEIKTGKEVIWNDVIGESAETKEARLLTQLKKMRRSYHPNCMRILDCWRHENRISFITERPDETYTTLRHWFNISRLRRNYATSKRLIRQVVSGLKYIADHSLVHGNISTDSILIYGTNVKLGPFSLDAYWHSHTVRKTTKKNFYLSSDWSDPAARITSLTDAYAMGVLCLEIVLWGPLDSELGEGDVDVPKYVLDKVEQFDDPLLRSFTKVCMSGNRQHGINDLFDVSAFFEPPSLRHAAAKVITDAVLAHFSGQAAAVAPATNQGPTQSSTSATKQTADINGAYQQLLRHARSSFEDDSIIAHATRADGSTRQLLFKDVAQYYISFKFLEDIDHGYYPMIKFDSSGKAVVPPHVRRIISGEWQKDEKEVKEKEKAGGSTGQSTAGPSALSEGAGGSSLGDAKVRKESKEVAAASDSTSARSAVADKVSPPRGAAASSAIASSDRPGTGSNTPSNVSRQPTASPARQPSKLPVADSQGVRKSSSISGITAGGSKAAGSAAEVVTGPAGPTGAGSGLSSATAAVQSATSGTASSGTLPAAPAPTSRSHTGVSGPGLKESKRSSISRSTASISSGPLAAQEAAGAGGPLLTGHGHGIVRRTGNKVARGACRASTGSTVAVRRRGGSTSPMPQRVRLHGIDTAGRLSRGGSSSLSSHARPAPGKASGGECASQEDPGRSHGQRTRRICSEGTTREHRRLSQTLNDNRMSHEVADKNAVDTTAGGHPMETSTTEREEASDLSKGLSAGAQVATLTESREVMHSSDEEEYEDDYEDYYEDDIEELYEEDEIEYESQFEQRGRRGQEEHMLNIMDVAKPVEAERGSAYFTDVFFEYLGLGRWLLVVKFHLLRCREDPRGNPYREVMLQLKDHEWHELDALVDRLTGSGLLMRPEERSILRQYLDAARHNRPLRETYVQNGIAGPDPAELVARLLSVQKERQNWAKSAPGTEPDSQGREEKAGSIEPGLCSEHSGQSSRQTEGWSRVRSLQETPASEPQPHSAACLNRVEASKTEKETKTAQQPGAREQPQEAAPGVKEEGEGDEEGSGKRTFACSCVPGTHGQNPLEPLNKYCPFCDRCDYLLVDGPVYLRSPCYHCRVIGAEKEGLSPEQLYRLHVQNRVPWPLFLQKYFSWPPDEAVTEAMALNACKWRSRVVCVCFHGPEVWPPCVEFPWLYNPPQGSIAYRMQVEQFSPSAHLEPMNLWCRRQSQRTETLKNISSITSMFRAGEKLPTEVGAGATPLKRTRADRDPELTARHQRRARSLTVGSEHGHWSQLFSMSIAMHHPPKALAPPQTEDAGEKAETAPVGQPVAVSEETREAESGSVPEQKMPSPSEG